MGSVTCGWWGLGTYLHWDERSSDLFLRSERGLKRRRGRHLDGRRCVLVVWSLGRGRRLLWGWCSWLRLVRLLYRLLLVMSPSCCWSVVGEVWFMRICWCDIWRHGGVKAGYPCDIEFLLALSWNWERSFHSAAIHIISGYSHTNKNENRKLFI